MRASQHFFVKVAIAKFKVCGVFLMNSQLFKECDTLLSRNTLAADFYWQTHFWKSILHIGLSEEPKFKVCMCAKGIIVCMFNQRKNRVPSDLYDQPSSYPCSSTVCWDFLSKLLRSPGTVFSARSDSLEIPWSVYFPRHNYRLLAVLALHPYTQMCVTVLCKCWP